MASFHHQKAIFANQPMVWLRVKLSLTLSGRHDCIHRTAGEASNAGPSSAPVVKDRMELGFQPVTVDTNASDEEGRLVFANNPLMAALKRLSHKHGRKAGCWYLEHGFGNMDSCGSTL
jgi:hypothetical protein